VECGEEDCKPGHYFGPYVRSFFLLHYVISGKGIFLREGVCNKVEKGQIFIIRPGEVTFYQADLKDPWHYIWIGFESSLDLPVLLSNDVLTAPECGHVFTAISEYSELSCSRELFLCGKIYELLALLEEQRQSATGTHAYIQKAEAYIRAHFLEKISISDLARHLGLDRSYFSTIFKKHTGMSPQQFLVGFRLERAAELLSQSLCSPKEAAERSGYSEMCNFSRMFKKRFGVSPQNYRKSRQAF